MPIYYEINVSFKGKHFFATAPRSCTNMMEAEDAYKAISTRFTKEDNFEVTCTKWESAGKRVNFPAAK